MPCLTVSLTPLGGEWCPSVLCPVSWPKPRTSPPPAVRKLHDSGPTEIEGLSQWETFVPGTCSQALPDPHSPTSPVLRATVRRLGAHQEGDLQEHGLILASPGNISGLPAVEKTPSNFLSLSSGDPWYCPVPPFQEELRRQPGLEGGYLAQSHHLHAPLPQGLVSQVPGHLPPRPRGGGSGHGITWPLTPEYLT